MPSKRPQRKFGASQKDRIFFACLPDVETAARIYRWADEFKREKSLDGTLILPDHLHVTLFHLGDWHSLPGEIVDLARTAAAQIRVAPFDVTFRRAGSFRNRTGHYPFVLSAYRDTAPWRPLRDALGAALKRAGLGAATQSEFKPHVTLLRDDTRIALFAIEPIAWTVRDFVLVHSLLGKTTHILTAEDIAEQLGLARSNVSNSIRELITWKLIRRVPVLGDRRDHYEAEADLWQIMTRIVQGRKEREIDPAVAAIHRALAAADGDPTVSKVARARLHEMQTFLGTLENWFSQMMRVPPSTIMRLIKLGSKVVKFLNLGRDKRGPI